VRAGTDAPGRHAGTTGLVLVAGSAVLFGANGTVSKLALGSGLSALRLVEARSLGAALLLLGALALARPASLRVRGWREAAFLAGAGVTGIALVQFFYFVAIARLPVSVALLLEFLAPVLVALWLRFARGRPVAPRTWVAIGLCLGGLALVAQVWRGLVLDGWGVLAGLAAAATLAVYYLTADRGLASRDAVSLAAWTFAAAALFWAALLPWWTFPVHVLDDAVALPGPLAGAVVPLWALVAWVVVLGTVVPYAMVLAGVARIGPTTAGLVGMLEPVLAGLVAWLVLGEALAPVQLVGGAVVLAGLALAQSARAVPAPAQAAQAVPAS